MFRRKLMGLAGFLLTAIAVLALSLIIRVKDPASSYTNHPTYAEPGPYHVGLRTLIADGGNPPLDITMWYPVLQDGTHAQEVTYPYEIKLRPPLGRVALATSVGQASRGVSYDLSAGPYPLVILSPGFGLSGTAYAWHAEHLASYGFVVMALEHRESLDPQNDLWRSTITRPQEVLAVLDYVGHQVGAGGPYERLIDPDAVAVTGHSYGGYTALAAAGARIDSQGFTDHCERARAANDPAVWLCDMLLPHLADMAVLAGLDDVPEGLWPAWSDPRVDAVVPMAGDAFQFGQVGLAEITVPVLAMGGTADTEAPYLWGTHPTYDYVSSPIKVRIGFEEGEHMLFTACCESTPLLLTLISGEFCDDTVWDRQRAHNLANHFTTAFLLAELKQDSRAERALVPDAVRISGVTYDVQGY
jgi:predicted dienelactone hydrolase